MGGGLNIVHACELDDVIIVCSLVFFEYIGIIHPDVLWELPILFQISRLVSHVLQNDIRFFVLHNSANWIWLTGWGI